jgi:hypothetical protein
LQLGHPFGKERVACFKKEEQKQVDLPNRLKYTSFPFSVIYSLKYSMTEEMRHLKNKAEAVSFDHLP